MGGGLLQLVAIGVQDIFLVKDPQITFFKMVYRRHTNFSIEQIKLDFNSKPNFGKKVSCTITKAGDLIHKVFLMVTLPKIGKFFDSEGNEDPYKRFMWVKRIGYALIKSVELEIGGQIIDRQYGEWMNIWRELTGDNQRGYNIMIGDIEEVNNFSNGKEEVELFIPLEFWFCKSVGSSIPIVALEYSKININVSFNDFDWCHVVGPTNSIILNEDIVNFKQYEFISQTVDGNTATGIFMGYDPITKKLYYNNISRNNFISPSDSTATTDAQLFTVSRNNPTYKITGLTSNYEVNPKPNVAQNTETTPTLKYNLKNVKLLVEYVFVDEEERMRLLKEKHEFLIEQIQFEGDKVVDSNIKQFRLGFLQPTKEILFAIRYDYLNTTRINDHYNYTNSFKTCQRSQNNQDKTLARNTTYIPDTGSFTTEHSTSSSLDYYLGTGLIKKVAILINGQERFSERDSGYLNYIQPYWHHNRGPCEGICAYSFGLEPEKIQPSGAINFSTIDHIFLRLTTDPSINFSNRGTLKVFTKAYNIFRIAHGVAGLVFTNN